MRLGRTAKATQSARIRMCGKQDHGNNTPHFLERTQVGGGLTSASLIKPDSTKCALSAIRPMRDAFGINRRVHWSRVGRV